MARLQEIVFEARDPPALARFWARLLDGYAVRPYDAAEIARLASLGLTPETDPSVMVDGPGPSYCFQAVPGRDYAANRLHLDLVAPNRAEAVETAVAHGGRVVRTADHCTVLLDPEGNQFCLLDPRPAG